MNNLYLLINLGAVSIPFIFSFHPRLNFYKQWKFAFPALLLPMLIFLPWDVYFTSIGVWGFDSRYITGIKLFNLPLEEVLFFICIPYACLFTYHCLSLWWPGGKSNRKTVFYLLTGIYALMGLLFINKAYTASTFLLLTIFHLVCIFTGRPSLSRFYKVYGALLIPFFMVNGMLTGTGIQDQVVWYNDGENLGIRLLTIPVEDVFYGMLLILMNVFFYELLRGHKAHIRSTAGGSLNEI